MEETVISEQINIQLELVVSSTMDMILLMWFLSSNNKNAIATMKQVHERTTTKKIR